MALLSPLPFELLREMTQAAGRPAFPLVRGGDMCKGTRLTNKSRVTNTIKQRIVRGTIKQSIRIQVIIVLIVFMFMVYIDVILIYGNI